MQSRSCRPTAAEHARIEGQMRSMNCPRLGLEGQMRSMNCPRLGLEGQMRSMNGSRFVSKVRCVV